MSHAAPNPVQSRLIIIPCELDEANSFVEQYHRHHGPTT